MSEAVALVVRDVRLAVRAGGGAALALTFFATVATLFPLGLGPDLALLSHVAGGVLWAAAVLASLLSLDRLFQADYDDGTLDLIAISPLSFEAVAGAKIAAHWITTGLPLTLLSPLAALMFGMHRQGGEALFVSLLVGTPGLSAIGAVGAALTVAIRRGGLVLPLIVLPLLSPSVIFGAGYVLAAIEGTHTGALPLLAAFSFAAVLLSPFASAAALRLNLAG